MTSKVHLLLGGNLGNREENLSNAILEIQNKIGEVKIKSSIYETAAWGMEDQPDFLNQVLIVETNMDAMEVLLTCLAIEKKLGRIRKLRWGERLIDIDLLFYGSEIINSQRLTVPHPEIQNRRFTLLPLLEIDPELIHPKLNKTIKELLETCPDHLEAKKLS